VADGEGLAVLGRDVGVGGRLGAGAVDGGEELLSRADPGLASAARREDLAIGVEDGAAAQVGGELLETGDRALGSACGRPGAGLRLGGQDRSRRDEQLTRRT
jgi:hypothetical protein